MKLGGAVRFEEINKNKKYTHIKRAYFFKFLF
jgi:hypothetical protein